MIEAYPLNWPTGRPRIGYRETARFDTTFTRARDEVVRQVGLMTNRYVANKDLIISSNVPLRRDGLPLANQREPDDPGVAVYFPYKKLQVCFACDRWRKVEHNLQAIAKTIDALRGVARWGTGDMVQAAFTGFVALPAPENWRTVFTNVGDLDALENAYRLLRSQHHPDRPGGSVDMFTRVQKAYEAARAELGHG